jgi:putative ABC transport system ATP-binding protein
MALTLRDLRKRYIGPDGSVVPVIDVAAFELADGEQVALVGSSGSGKTTLLHMIAGILTPDSGQILFQDAGTEPGGGAGDPIDLTALSEAERDIFRGRHIGYIFQTHHLLPGFTALENVLLGMSFTGRKHDPQWAGRLLQEVGLGERIDYKPQRLSVGQQQRVAVARALANRPKLVLADEPTGALDSKTAQQVLELIRRLCTEVGASLILVTHDLQISKQFDRVVVLSELNRAQPEPAATPHVVL